ncbi:MAG: response regulator transcription factor [Lachnospiraceae bacterium]|nr:response regulator transcription factor [Lachnospiraceae bacterium]
MVDILVVEDNKEISGLITDFLRAENYIVTTVDSGEKALSVFEKYGARLVLLDIMLPGIDGFAVCEKIRKISDAPIIILSARVEKDDKLNGLILGADDYMEKPYDIDILLAKIQGIFKRRYSMDEITCGKLTLNKIEKTVYKDGRLLDTRAKEFELLLLLIENKGKTLTKEYIFNQIWGSDSESELQTLTVHIKWLREKIEDNPKQPEHILTVWGTGYKYIE